MPLSEDEHRILQQIEAQFYEDDPSFAKGVSSIYRPAARALKWAAAGMVAGFAILLATFTVSLLVAFVGVAVMFASAVWFERSLRRLGKVGWNQVTSSMRGGHVLKDRFGGAGQRMRDRFRRDDS